MAKVTFNKIPGLFLFPDFFSESESADLTDKTIELYSKLKVEDTGSLVKANIPQPDFVKSQKHNLESEEYFARKRLDENGEKLSCEFFPTYGESGHSLAYFRGNQNLPNFIRESLPKIQSLMKRERLLNKDDPTWKLTVNFYKNINGETAGFPFHVDIPANGIVTMIMNIQKSALFQIAKDNQVHDISIPVGGLLVLSGESRYEWKHRVLPEESQSTGRKIERVSLVLGFQ